MIKVIKLKKWHIITAVIILALALCAVWIICENENLGVTEYKISSEEIPQSFSGFRIAQISDLHNAELGKNNKKIIDAVKKSNVDIIVITGDFFDSRNTDIGICLSLTEELVKIAPVYYINGNQEPRVIDKYTTMIIEFKKLGVKVLENETVFITKNGEKITISGLYDVGYLMKRDIDKQLSSFSVDKEYYNILLAHRPDFFKKYHDYDLIITGHAHGGQIRIPFIGGLFVPDQGFFPEYDSGVYKNSTSTMVVSRGIGNSAFPIRVNNNPEVVIIELESK